MKYNHHIRLIDGAKIKNFMIGTHDELDQVMTGVWKAVAEENSGDIVDIQVCSNGVDWFSLRGYKAQNTYEGTEKIIPVLDGLSNDGRSYKFRVLKAGGEAGSEALTISNSGGIITIDLSDSFKDKIDDIEEVLSGKVDKELKTGSQSAYKVLSDNNFTDLLLAKLSTIQIKQDTLGKGKYYLVYNDGENDIQLGGDIFIDSVIKSGSVKECIVPNEPVNGYEVGNKYIDFEIANSSEHVYILVSDLVVTMQGVNGTEVKTTIVDGNKIQAELKDNSIDIARLKKIVLGTITGDNQLIGEEAEYTLKEAIIVLACNIKDLYERKANKAQAISVPVSDSDQITEANDYDITLVLQKALNNIKYLFDNKANSDHSHEGVYLKPTDVVDNITDSSTTKPLSAKQGKMLGGLINERLKGVKVDGVELTPDANKIVDIPVMAGASASTNGEVGLVPKPLSGQQSTFLRGDGTYGLPNADVVASASYVGGTPNPKLNGMTRCQSVVGGNVEILLSNAYVAREAFPGAVDIVRVMRNGLDLTEGEDFTIEEGSGYTRQKITLIDYPLHTEDDIILVRYKTSIGVYGSVFQETIDNAIQVTTDANTAAQRAEDAAIDAENIADSKIDKTSIAQDLGNDETKVISQKGFTDTINNYSNLWYGVSWNNSLSTIPSTKTRIGNSDLHRSLPIHSKMKGCLMADDGKIIKYLPDNSWVGETLDGTSGQVMVELPEYYFKVDDTDQTNVQLKISTLPLPNFKYSPKMYIGAYKGVIDRTIPATLKLASVVNSAVEFRGGNNSATNDSNENSLLGKASSSITGTNYRTYARNRNAGDTRWNRYIYEAWRKLVFLYLIEYANTNSQATYNAALDVNGFKQGGLGMGVTQINSTKWSAFNGYYPFIPIGYSNSIGNGTGEIAYTMPYLYDGGAAYKGDYSADATYVAEDYISAKSVNKLYRCIADAPAGALLSDTNYFTEVTRTTTLVNRYRGVELPFGEIWENLDGTLINADADNQNIKLYLCSNPQYYGDTLTDKYIYRGELPTSSDYIKKIMLGKNGDILPLKDGLGASTSNGWCDYHSASIASSGLRALFVGGGAYSAAAGAGLVCSCAYDALSYSYADVGSRLCFIP